MGQVDGLVLEWVSLPLFTAGGIGIGVRGNSRHCGGPSKEALGYVQGNRRE